MNIFFFTSSYYIISSFQGSKRDSSRLLLAHTMDVIMFPLDASIVIKINMLSVQLTINAITFHRDLSIVIETSGMTVDFPMAELCNAIPVIPIQSAHPMWYLIHIFPTVPVVVRTIPLPLEGLLGCEGRLWATWGRQKEMKAVTTPSI